MKKIKATYLILLHTLRSMWPFISDISNKSKRINFCCWKCCFSYLCNTGKCRVYFLLSRLGKGRPTSEHATASCCKHQAGITLELGLNVEEDVHDEETCISLAVPKWVLCRKRWNERCCICLLRLMYFSQLNGYYSFNFHSIACFSSGYL